VERLKKWLRKVVTGVAAVLLVCFQFLSTANVPVGVIGSPFQYAWTEYGVRATWGDEFPIAQTEEEVREKRIWDEMKREREKREKAAS
jgi:hypothetical protein